MTATHWIVLAVTLMVCFSAVIIAGIWADTRMKETKVHYDLMKKPGTGEKPT